MTQALTLQHSDPTVAFSFLIIPFIHSSITIFPVSLLNILSSYRKYLSSIFSVRILLFSSG